MKKIFFIFVVSVFFVTGCKFSDDYTVQYSLSSQDFKNSSLSIEDGIVKLIIPFADFSCDPKSFKVDLDKNQNDFTLVIKGKETEARCYQAFIADVSGVESGSYTFKIIYDRTNNKQEVVMYKNFTIVK